MNAGEVLIYKLPEYKTNNSNGDSIEVAVTID